MHKLILMRHAKSDWSQDGLSDKQRPLNKRGREAAPKAASWLRVKGHVPDRALVSSATRTQETWDLMKSDFPETSTEASDAMYLADPHILADHIKRQSARTLIVIAHNPGIAWLAKSVLAETPTHPKFDKYPTAAVLVAQFSISDWQELKAGSGSLVNFVVPGDLS